MTSPARRAQLQMLVWCRVLAPIQAARIAVQTVPTYRLDTLTFLKCAPGDASAACRTHVDMLSFC